MHRIVTARTEEGNAFSEYYKGQNENSKSVEIGKAVKMQ